MSTTDPFFVGLSGKEHKGRMGDPSMIMGDLGDPSMGLSGDPRMGAPADPRMYVQSAHREGGGSGGVVLGVLVLLIAAIGGYFYMQTQKAQAKAAQESAEAQAQAATASAEARAKAATAEAASAAAKAKATAEKAAAETKAQQQTEDAKMRAYALCQAKEKAKFTYKGTTLDAVKVGSCTPPSSGHVYMKCMNGFYGNHCSEKCPTATNGFDVSTTPFVYKSGYALGAPAADLATCECRSENHFATVDPQAPESSNSCTAKSPCAPGWHGDMCTVASNANASKCGTQTPIKVTDKPLSAGTGTKKCEFESTSGSLKSGCIDPSSQKCLCYDDAQWTGEFCDTRPLNYCTGTDKGATYDTTTETCECSDGFTGSDGDAPCQQSEDSTTPSYVYSDGTAQKWDANWVDISDAYVTFVGNGKGTSGRTPNWGANVCDSQCQQAVKMCTILSNPALNFEYFGLNSSCVTVAGLCGADSGDSLVSWTKTSMGPPGCTLMATNNQTKIAPGYKVSLTKASQWLKQVIFPKGSYAKVWAGDDVHSMTEKSCVYGSGKVVTNGNDGGTFDAFVFPSGGNQYLSAFSIGLQPGYLVRCIDDGGNETVYHGAESGDAKLPKEKDGKTIVSSVTTAQGKTATLQGTFNITGDETAFSDAVAVGRRQTAAAATKPSKSKGIKEEAAVAVKDLKDPVDDLNDASTVVSIATHPGLSAVETIEMHQLHTHKDKTRKKKLWP